MCETPRAPLRLPPPLRPEPEPPLLTVAATLRRSAALKSAPDAE